MILARSDAEIVLRRSIPGTSPRCCNSFEVPVVAAADLFYRDGSILHASTQSQTFIVALISLLMAVLLLGLLDRQRHGPGRIGWEGLLIVAPFLAGDHRFG